jgi:Ca2+-binding RTX toxin-like protein
VNASGGGDDTIYLYGGNDRGVGNTGNDTIWGGAGADWLQGVDGFDRLFGEAGNDELWDQKGEDRLEGGDGDDLVWGGADRDDMWGGAGADKFEYRTFWESTTRPFNDTHDGTPMGEPNPEFSDVTGGMDDVDVIHDFEPGLDKIWLTKLDADVSTPVINSPKGSTGNDDFVFTTKTSGFAARDLTLTYSRDAIGNVTQTRLDAHVDSDGIPDLTIVILGYVRPVDILY